MIKLRLALLFLASCFAISAFCQTYITNVTIVDVANQKLVPAQTVVIKNGIISNIQPSKKIKIPSGFTVIDGKGKYLIPGLTDAHVHFFQSGGLYARPDAIDLRKYYPYEKEINWVHNNMEDFLRRYVKAGITSVIDVGSNYHFLQQRDSFENKTYAPRIFMTGPLLTSYEPPVFKNLKNEEPFILVKTAEDGIKGVQGELPYHPDFIKIWYIVSPNKDSIEASAKEFEPVAKAIIDEAHKHHLKVAVHATQRITAQLAVESGCDYLVHGIDDEIVSDDFIKLLKSKNVIDCPTLIVEDGYFKTFGQNMHYSAYDVAISNPQQLESIQDLKHVDTTLAGFYKNRFNMPAIKNRLKHEDSVRMANLKKMIDGGITIVAGTDAGNIGTQHASSLFDELKAMKESGLSNWQIIQSATINPTKILDKQDNLGSIAIGKKADLVLLNANPVEDLDNITHINLVINKGKVIYPSEIAK
jgi:imidazolonepropionase-like amidohydrolase